MHEKPPVRLLSCCLDMFSCFPFPNIFAVSDANRGREKQDRMRSSSNDGSSLEKGQPKLDAFCNQCLELILPSRAWHTLSATTSTSIGVETAVATSTTSSVVGARSSSILGACGRISRCIRGTRRRGSVTTTPSAASSSAKSTARGKTAVVASRTAALVGCGNVVVHALPACG